MDNLFPKIVCFLITVLLFSYLIIYLFVCSFILFTLRNSSYRGIVLETIYDKGFVSLQVVNNGTIYNGSDCSKVCSDVAVKMDFLLFIDLY